MNLLFISDLWSYATLVSGGATAVVLQPEASSVLASPVPVSSPWGVVWGSWWLLSFLAANIFGTGFSSFLLFRMTRMAMQNLTTNEVG